MNIMPYILEMKNLSMAYKGQNGSPVKVFNNFNLSVEAGTFLAVLGPSGCGKTTFLNLIGSLVKETAGEITVLGMSPDDARQERAFSYVFQNPVLLPWRTVRENAILAGEVFHDAGIVQKAETYLNLVGLSDFFSAYPSELSGGMQSRVAIARAFSYEPKLLLLDEPFGSLDSLTRLSMNALLMDLLNQNHLITTILVTHSINEAIFLGDRVIVLSERPAQILWDKPILLDRPRDRNSQKFMSYQKEIEQIVFGNNLKLKAN